MGSRRIRPDCRFTDSGGKRRLRASAQPAPLSRRENMAYPPCSSLAQEYRTAAPSSHRAVCRRRDRFADRLDGRIDKPLSHGGTGPRRSRSLACLSASRSQALRESFALRAYARSRQCDFPRIPLRRGRARFPYSRIEPYAARRHSRARRIAEPRGRERQGDRFPLVSPDHRQPSASDYEIRKSHRFLRNGRHEVAGYIIGQLRTRNGRIR